mgnify:CR=1 FL=1
MKIKNIIAIILISLLVLTSISQVNAFVKIDKKDRNNKGHGNPWLLNSEVIYAKPIKFNDYLGNKIATGKIYSNGWINGATKEKIGNWNFIGFYDNINWCIFLYKNKSEQGFMCGWWKIDDYNNDGTPEGWWYLEDIKDKKINIWGNFYVT